MLKKIQKIYFFNLRGKFFMKRYLLKDYIDILKKKKI